MDAPQSPSEEQKMAGGVELEVEFNDGHKERVLVRYLRPIKQRQRYLEVFADEDATIELFCDRPAGWAQSLAPESYDDVIDQGQELNLPLFRKFYRRLTARSEAINPGLLEKAREKALASAVSQNQESAEG